MAEAITLNIGNGAATLAYNEVVYSKFSDGITENCNLYTWQIMLIINPMSIGPAFILPYSAWNNITSNKNIAVYYSIEGSNVRQSLARINNSGHAQYLYENSILMLLK